MDLLVQVRQFFFMKFFVHKVISDQKAIHFQKVISVQKLSESNQIFLGYLRISVNKSKFIESSILLR